MADQPKPSRKERFTVVEMGSPLDPSPEELAARGTGAPAVPPAVVALVAQLADAVGALGPKERAVALRHISEFTKKLAG